MLESILVVVSFTTTPLEAYQDPAVTFPPSPQAVPEPEQPRYHMSAAQELPTQSTVTSQNKAAEGATSLPAPQTLPAETGTMPVPQAAADPEQKPVLAMVFSQVPEQPSQPLGSHSSARSWLEVWKSKS